MECQHVPANVSSAASFESLFLAVFCLSLKAENGQELPFVIVRTRPEAAIWQCIFQK